MKVHEFGNGDGPQHVKVRLDDTRLVPARQLGDSKADQQEIHRRNLARHAEIRSEDIAQLAALIREVDGGHNLGAAALAEALIDRGVMFRQGE